MKKKEEIPAFGIKRIKEFSFLVNESLFDLNKDVRIKFQHQTRFIEDRNLIDLTLRVYYTYDVKIPPESLLVDFHVQNLFEVMNLNQYKSDSNEFILPQNLIIAMLGVAISHLRALMAHNVAGTSFQDNIIPIVNPVDVAQAFYPNMFKNVTSNNFKESIKTEDGFKRERIKKK